MSTLKMSPLIKGMVAGAVMVAVNLALLATGKADSPATQYLFYILYAGAITWTLLGYYRSAEYTPKFGSIFNQGFRCFIIIAIINVVFTAVYSSMHPELAEEAANNYRTEMQKSKQQNRTPAEIEQDVKNIKEHFVTANIWAAVFGSLIIGAIFTAAGAGLLLMRRT